MGLGVSSPKAGVNGAARSVINYPGWETAGLAGALRPVSSRRGSGGAPGEREQGWTPREHWEEEKEKGLGMDRSPRSGAREGASVAAARSLFGAPQDLAVPQMGLPARPPKNSLAAKGKQLSRALHNREKRRPPERSRVAAGQRSALKWSRGYREGSAD